MTRRLATTHRRRRNRERWSVVAVFVLAAAAGLLAAHFGMPRSWENAPAVVSTSTSVPFTEPRGNP